jgi:Flagellar protein YcgR
MPEFLTLILSFSAVFTVGFVAAKGYLAMKALPNKDSHKPVENAQVRMKTSDALYRCRLISSDANGWIFTAPMHRDNFVPVAVGEEVKCEVVANGGLLIFTTKVIARKPIEGTIIVAAPKSVELDNRRTHLSRREVAVEVVIGGKSGSVMDLSPGGARVKIQGFEREGNMVRVDMPGGESRGATIVDSKNDHLGSTVRLRFDEAIEIN